MAFDPNEKSSQPITKFESMLKTDDIYFFDAEDFEDIIHHYLNNGKIALAKKAVSISMQQHPNNLELKLLKVEILVFENDLIGAEHLLDELQYLDKGNEEILIQRANIYSKKDDHKTAITHLQTALQLTDDTADIHALLGMEYLFLDDYKSAKDAFINCVQLDVNDVASLYNVIYCFEILEDFDNAILFLNDYLEQNPYSEIAWHQLGKQYYAKKLYKEAITAFDFAIIADDEFVGAYYEKGKTLEKLGRYNEAIDNYEATITIEDPTSHAYLRMGKCHEKLENYDLAKYFYYQTVHEDPLLDKGWLAITKFYLRKKKFDKALYYVNKAINIDGENASYWKICGEINAALGHLDEADFAFKQAVDLGNYEKNTWLSWAKVVQGIDEVASAIQILTQGQEFYPEEPVFGYTLVGLHLKLNDTLKAKATLQKALTLDTAQLSELTTNFKEYSSLTWVNNIISDFRKASE